jgi:DNA-binding NarL/FixJ family response regulator
VHDKHEQLAPAIRVVLAEDGVLLREGLAGLLQRFGFHVVAMAGDAGELHAAAAQHQPDLVITDIRMPPSFTDEGLRAATSPRASPTPRSRARCSYPRQQSEST